MENFNIDTLINEVMKEVIEKVGMSNTTPGQSETSSAYDYQKPAVKSAEKTDCAVAKRYGQKFSAYDFQNRLESCSVCENSSVMVEKGQESAYNFQNQ